MDQNKVQEDNNIIQPNIPPISKKQIKKALKKSKAKEHNKQKRLEKKIAKKQQIPLKEQEKIKTVIQEDEKGQEKKNKKTRREVYKEKQTQGTNVIIDLQFLNQMTEPEKISLYKQIELCHSINFKSENPVNLHVTSLDNNFQKLLDKSQAQNWGIDIQQKHYLDLWDKEDLIYLSGDSKQDMEELQPGKSYIIGGLVDHNRLKDITFQKANEQGIKTLRFPINQNVVLKTSSILTVNQVFEILLRLQNGEQWQEAIDKAIPKRKKII